ncbi:MAG: MFS transporter [Gammaproteobacteria bacterium]|nr:MAG: MFS transporter [Gammaproteobacteria bacterium]
MLFLGFSAGLPILLVFGTLSVWLNEAGIKKSAITYFSWAGLGYGFKFVWAPLIDQARLPLLTTWLGKRRSWLLLCQLVLLAILAGMAMTDPVAGDNGLLVMALLAVALGFASASQDIVIDAYRIEITPPRLLGMSASTYTLGYRVAMIIAGAMALVMSEKLGSGLNHYHYGAWRSTYLFMAALMMIGVVTTLVIGEPTNSREALNSRGSKQLLLLFLVLLIPFIAVYYWWNPVVGSLISLSDLSPAMYFVVTAIRFLTAALCCYMVAWLLIKLQWVPTSVATASYWHPVKEFIQRYPLGLVVTILLLIGFYRISDMVLGVIANIFYQDIGFSKESIGYASKFFGVIVTLLGSFWGGYLIVKFGVMRMLLWGAILAAATNLLFMLLAAAGNQLWLLYSVIIADNLAAGIASIAFVTFLSRLSNIRFTAMQYAIFTSVMILLPRVLGGYSGGIVEATNYQTFFLITTLMGLPVVLLVWFVGRRLTLDEEKT